MVYICIDHVVKFPTLVVRETNEFEDADFFLNFGYIIVFFRTPC